jgi:hypothetical protein
MLKKSALTIVLGLSAIGSASAENWRYCAARAPITHPCQTWVAAYLGGHAPETDPKEVPRYQADSALARRLQAENRTDIPSFGNAQQLALQPFVKTAAVVIVR